MLRPKGTRIIRHLDRVSPEAIARSFVDEPRKPAPHAQPKHPISRRWKNEKVARRVLAQTGIVRSESVPPVRIGGVLVGGGTLSWIATIPNLQSAEHAVQYGSQLGSGGMKFFSAGLLSGDSRVRAEMLKLLAAACRRFGLQPIVPVADARDLTLVRKYTDAIEIAAEHASDKRLLKGIAKLGGVVLLHRPRELSLDRLHDIIGFIEREKATQVILIEDCGRSDEAVDIASLVALRRVFSHPFILNLGDQQPDQGFIESLAAAAVSVGVDGIMVGIGSGEAPLLSASDLSRIARRVEALKFTLNALAHAPVAR